jgi:pimeloyl-ACP methyl ester carboxylesterase
MVLAAATRSGHVEVNAARLYYEERGGGPSLLLIPGGTVDATHYAAVADLLADEFRTVTYDRRANGRSPRPSGWHATSIAEQADDAAGLLRALEATPAMVVGHSGGASIACGLVARHPELVRHAVLYEAPLAAVVPDGEAVVAGFRAVIDRAMAEGGSRRAMEAFMRANASDEVVDRVLASVPPAELDRILGNGAVLFELELPMYAGFVPDTDRMRAGGVPLTVVVGAENRDTWYGAAAAWLAEGTGAELVELPGGHGALFTHPQALVELVRARR